VSKGRLVASTFEAQFKNRELQKKILPGRNLRLDREQQGDKMGEKEKQEGWGLTKCYLLTGRQ